LKQVAMIRSQKSGFSHGGIVPGIDQGFDNQTVNVRPGEAVLPPELTNFLLEASAGGGAAQPIEVHLHGSLPTLVDEITQGVRRGSLRLEAASLAGARL